MGHAQIFCQMKGLMKIHNCGKFHLYSICGCQVINFQFFLWQYSIHELGHFVQICTRGSIQGGEDSVSKIFGKFKVLRKLHVTKVCTFFSVFAQLWPHFTPWSRLILKKLIFLGTKFSHRAIQISQNQGPIWSQFFKKNTITFCFILAVFC